MIGLKFCGPSVLTGVEPRALAPYREYDLIRQVERASIRRFLEEHKQYLKGRVLDFGSGKQPYKDLVDGQYFPHEQGEEMPLASFDCVLCTQVVQYLDSPASWLRYVAWPALVRGGHLVMTYATNWDEVEISDLWRFSRYGMEKMLRDAGFALVEHQRRAEIAIDNFKFPLGYGCIARK